MATLKDIRARSTWGHILEGQPQHVLMLVLLLTGALLMLENTPGGRAGFGLSSHSWAVLSIWLAILHQIIVAIVFRLQLHKNLLSRLFGQRDMMVWTIVFMPLLIARPLTLLLTGWTDGGAIPGPFWLKLLLGAALLVPAIWALYSTVHHFTLRRAVGGDHFREDIRALPPVKGGVFDYTANGMYGVAFLGLWAIALLTNSWNALMVALFQHAYIWVHFYTVEQPDMRRLYGPNA